MREYLKPALEMDEFDVEDIITASVIGGDTPGGETPGGPDTPPVDPTPGQLGGDDVIGAPIIVDFN